MPESPLTIIARIREVLPDVRPAGGYEEGADADYASAALSEIDNALDTLEALLVEDMIRAS